MRRTESRLMRVTAIAAILLLVLAGALPAAPTTTVTAPPSAPVAGATGVVAAGGLHSCALRPDGTVACWGHDYSGESTPPDGTFIALSATMDRTCGIRTGGALACWGSDGGDAASPPSGTYTALSLGPAHGCAIRASGRVACWGDDRYGAASPPAGTFLAIDASDNHSCAVSTAGRLVCWGGSRSDPLPTPPKADLLDIDGDCALRVSGTIKCWGSLDGKAPAGTFTELGTPCAVRTDGTVACWGDDSFGDMTPPPGTFTNVDGSYNNACAGAGDGSVACWGGDWIGQSSIAPTASVDAGEPWLVDGEASITWAARPAISSVVSFDVRVRRAGQDGVFSAYEPVLDATTTTGGTFPLEAGMTSCFSVRAHAADDAVSRWTDEAWQASQSGCVTTPVDDRALDRTGDWSEISLPEPYLGTALESSTAGATLRLDGIDAHDVAVVATMCPGCGSISVTFGGWPAVELTLDAPVRIERQLLQVATSGEFTTQTWPGDLTIEVTSDGDPVTIDGVLATPIAEAPEWVRSSRPPQPAATTTDHAVQALSAGGDQTCAIRPGGRVICWSRSEGLLNAPTGTFTAIEAGELASCALRSDGTVACWPPGVWDGSGQSPKGTYKALSTGLDPRCAIRVDGTLNCWSIDFLRPQPTGTFTSVSAGREWSCGLRTNGAIACWHSLLGEPEFAPTGTFLQVSVGRGHACALRTDSTLLCWGSNAYGQADAPAGTFAAVSAGAVHTCGRRDDGTIACWGDNHYLQTLAPSGAFVALDAGFDHTCATRADGTFACWGQDGAWQVTPHPRTTMGDLPTWSLDPQVSLTWRPSSLVPVETYDVRSFRAPWPDAFGDPVDAVAGTPSIAGTFDVEPGSAYCFEARGHDADGRVGDWSVPSCTWTPVDDRGLVRSPGWTRRTPATAYRGTALVTRQSGATLKLRDAPRYAAIVLIATKCPTCGTVRVYWDGRLVRTVSLYASQRVDRRQIVIRGPSGENERQGTVRIVVVSSGRRVIIDGLGIGNYPAGWPAGGGR